RLESFHCVACDQFFARDEKIGVRLFLRPADAASKLVELGEAELIGAVHDDRVRSRNVEARLDDRRAKKDVKLMTDEFKHRFFKGIFRHLTVSDSNTRLGN